MDKQTVDQPGGLKEAVQATRSNQQAVLVIFKHTREAYTPTAVSRLLTMADRPWPAQTVTRCIDRLRESNDLVKTGVTCKNGRGIIEDIWQINKHKYPVQTSVQAELF